MARAASPRGDREPRQEPVRSAHQLLGADGDGGGVLAGALSVNAVFSAVSGVTLAVGAPILSGGFGVDAWILAGIGGGLVVFAGLLVWLLADPRRLAAAAGWVLAADLAWIVGAIALLALAPGALTTAGQVALAAVTAVVGLIAVGQLVGLRRRRSRPGHGVYLPGRPGW